jgi:hypothetical protein
MATSPLVLQGPILGQAIVNNASGTAVVNIYSAGANGAFLKNLVIVSGPTTAPGGTYTAAIVILDGATTTTIIKTFSLINTVDTEQLSIFLGFELAAAAQIQIQLRTALASGATLHCTLDGKTY